MRKKTIINYYLILNLVFHLLAILLHDLNLETNVPGPLHQFFNNNIKKVRKERKEKKRIKKREEKGKNIKKREERNT